MTHATDVRLTPRSASIVGSAAAIPVTSLVSTSVAAATAASAAADEREALVTR
jgi:hypothetical protein